MAANEKLGPGDIFPELQLNVVGEGDVVLPTDIHSPYAIVLIYRGHW